MEEKNGDILQKRKTPALIQITNKSTFTNSGSLFKRESNISQQGTLIALLHIP
jgi:hypothetical protein